MDDDALFSILKLTELPIAQGAFKQKKNPPFIVFLSPNSTNFNADNQKYIDINSWQIELYSNEIDKKNEKNLENILTENNICYDKTRTYNDSEKLWMVFYQFEELE